MKYKVEYWVGFEWHPLETFATKEQAQSYIAYESHRDEYMSATTGIDHRCDYRIVEVKA